MSGSVSIVPTCAEGPVRKKAHFSSGITGRPTSAAASSWEHEATTRVSSKAVFSMISGRNGPKTVPADTSGGSILGDRPTAFNRAADHVREIGLKSCVALASDCSNRGTPLSR
jgi:hypothetical protein